MDGYLSGLVSRGMPEELAPVLVRNWTLEYASIRRDGTPVTVPVIPTAGEGGQTIDVNTGLAYPTKAERARNNPRVCLLYSESRGAAVEHPPVVLVYGHASVHDADLQGNTDRYVRASLERMPMFRMMPGFVFRQMYGYLARIWIAVTPVRVLWWPRGDLDAAPRRWEAPADIELPASDPKPEPLASPHGPIIQVREDWHRDLAHALDHLGPPVLTVVDTDGYPVPFRVRRTTPTSRGVLLDLHPAAPAAPAGRACLTFHTIGMARGSMLSNENMTFLGHLTREGGHVWFVAERQLPGVSFKLNPGGMVTLIRVILGFRKRLAIEAARRGQPVPVVRLPR